VEPKWARAPPTPSAIFFRAMREITFYLPLDAGICRPPILNAKYAPDQKKDIQILSRYLYDLLIIRLEFNMQIKILKFWILQCLHTFFFLCCIYVCTIHSEKSSIVYTFPFNITVYDYSVYCTRQPVWIYRFSNSVAGISQKFCQLSVKLYILVHVRMQYSVDLGYPPPPIVYF